MSPQLRAYQRLQAVFTCEQAEAVATYFMARKPELSEHPTETDLQVTELDLTVAMKALELSLLREQAANRAVFSAAMTRWRDDTLAHTTRTIIIQGLLLLGLWLTLSQLLQR